MENISKVQNVILENRNKLNITGVLDVLNFDEEIITVVTELGILIIKGNDLKLNRFSLDNTELSVEGEIDSLQYNDKTKSSKNKESLFTRIFK